MVPVARALGSEVTPCASARRRILVVDDSRMQLRIISAQLARSDFEVITAISAEEALGICAHSPPDIVISDWMMTGMNGPDFCRAFRRMERASYGYFILLTSKSDTMDVSHGLESGADDFLSKPVNGSELRARLIAGQRILAMHEELSAKNALLRSSQEAIERDLREARKLQQSLVREDYRSFGTAEVSLLLRPVGHVGGDLVGFFPINARRVGLYGIDVSGHGITSAVMVARLAGYLSGASAEQNLAMVESEFGIYEGRPPAELAAMLNELVLEEMQTESYFTLVYADVDLVTGEVVLVQAGHPYPVVQRRSGEVEFIGNGGLPVGLIAGARYDSVQTRLHPGDRLILLSDGMTEAMTPEGKMIDHDGLAAIFQKFAQLRGRAFLEAVSWELDAWAQEAPADDVSAVVFSFDGAKINLD
ncbi:chemotaxis protein CheY [Thioclava dalianensis]|uniref:Chemotaxis protein CheY n=1 Tax=Thioclava dalianensis TaxID=1185766 RepID=A0A074TJT5_9RHOB|nr:SpoIIE family protein phosphatase [Thioclava dalianensis]KEP70435.1 chemotaxis protein CheY [Thioclava dalianensis]